jgi:hypothetical protein
MNGESAAHELIDVIDLSAFQILSAEFVHV